MDREEDFFQKLSSFNKTVVFTGAGISAESGIPTFRGKDGIWNKLKPEELANFDAFLRNPQLVWEWYNHRKEIVQHAQPNKGHTAIAEMEKYFEDFSVVTQNIDNLHRRAGSKNVFELHGNIERNYCIDCRTFYNEDFNPADKIPRCKCGGLIRPDVVWFGEYLPQDQFKGAEDASLKCDVFFVVGTSAIVYPAASLIYTTKRAGAYLVEVNIEPTEISSLVDISFYEKSGVVLPIILEELKSKKN